MNSTELTEAAILDALRQVLDPESGCNIVDLGLVYGIAMREGRVKVTMTLTTPGCPMHESICSGVQNALLSLPQITEAEVELVWDPRWNPSMMTEAGREITGSY